MPRQVTWDIDLFTELNRTMTVQQYYYNTNENNSSVYTEVALFAKLAMNAAASLIPVVPIK